MRTPRPRRRVAIAATILLLTGAGAFAFSDRIRYAYIALERSARVVYVLAFNINDYYWILRKPGDDPEMNAKLSATHKRCAERTLDAMERNGSVFIKLGQHLTSLNYILPNEWCDTFIPLQDKCPISSYSAIDAMVRQDTGMGLEDYFSDFDPRPIGAASLAQVHIATLKATGEKVAVKVQHPHLDEWSKLDIALTNFTFGTIKWWFPSYDITWLGDEMATSLPKELDFREEGRNALRAKAYFARLPQYPLVIPDVVWADRRILVMEYLTGHRLDDLAFLDKNGIDRDEVSAALARIFNEMIFGKDAPLHCDPHGGNLAIRINPAKRRPRNFEVILYDHGLYRDIPEYLRRAYAHIWLAVLSQDMKEMRKYAYEIAGLDDDESEQGVAKERNTEEKRAFSEALGTGGLLEKLVHLLAKVPRVILLILKTNDLTRSLDENLHTREGPVRTFMILARYAAHCVFEEQIEGLGSLWWPGNLWLYSIALLDYGQVAAKLKAYELYLSARRRLGYTSVLAGMDGLQRR